MLSVEAALELILQAIHPLEVEAVPLAEAFGRVLAEDVVATYDLPPFANSSMDGYAVRATDTTSATATQPVTLQVIEDIPAGHAPQHTVHSGQAARIMTGAPLPQGATAIVPVEAT